ncbi:MAG: ferritin-like domain-containing protein [Oscillibacter sp.]|jgi:rubrerythrin|nr:ferritin-like domain-containing protein [Oscillibacter sp.]
MDNDLRGGANAAVPYDYHQYDRAWARVSPSLTPYPGAVPAAEMTPPAQPAPPSVPEENLPGAQADPCCMGTAASEMLEVLEGFLADELADCRYYTAMARQAPSWARPTLREMAMDERDHARHLAAVYYLITGRCCSATVSCDRIYIGAWCPALRERYHAEACGGMNYLRASEGTTDPCLARIFKGLSVDEYRHSELLTQMLERSLNGTCNGMHTGV